MPPPSRTVPCPRCRTMLSMADLRCPWCGSTATPGMQRAVAQRRAVGIAWVVALLVAVFLLVRYLGWWPAAAAV